MKNLLNRGEKNNITKLFDYNIDRIILLYLKYDFLVIKMKKKILSYIYLKKYFISMNIKNIDIIYLLGIFNYIINNIINNIYRIKNIIFFFKIINIINIKYLILEFFDKYFNYFINFFYNETIILKGMVNFYDLKFKFNLLNIYNVNFLFLSFFIFSSRYYLLYFYKNLLFLILNKINIFNFKKDYIALVRRKVFYKLLKKVIVKSNYRLIVSIIKRYSNLNSLFPDLLQEGYLGLIKAVDKFSYSKGFRFSTYATWWIIQAVTRYISYKYKIIHIPVHVLEYISYIKGDRLDKRGKIGYKDVGRACKLKYVLENIGNPTSLEEHIASFGDVSYGNNDCVLDREEYYFDLRVKLNSILSSLGKKEEKIVRMRYGLNKNCKKYTLENIGRIFNVTRERIRQIEFKVLNKLKHPSRSFFLNFYF